MRLTNSPIGYGAITKTLHWLVALGFVYQYVVGTMMTAIEANDFALGFSQATLYNWHKSIGLVVLGIVIIRYTWRKTTRLPDWAAGLADWEKKLIHWYERMLYWAMFVMPLSGYLFVESGGYGVQFFGVTRLPTFLPRNETLAWLGHTLHIITGYAIVIFLTLHIGLVIKHQIWDKDGIVKRMLPFAHQ